MSYYPVVHYPIVCTGKFCQKISKSDNTSGNCIGGAREFFIFVMC